MIHSVRASLLRRGDNTFCAVDEIAVAALEKAGACCDRQIVLLGGAPVIGETVESWAESSVS